MSEKPKTLPETKKKPGNLSLKVRNLIQAFSLSVGLIISGNVFAQDTNNNVNNLLSYQSGGKQDLVFNELKYNFIEKNAGIVGAILEKLKDEGSFEKSFISDFEYIQNDIVIFFSGAIKRNGLILEYYLDNEVINELSLIKSHIEILLNLRYGRGYCYIFDGKDHSKSSLKIVFKKTDNGYIIENLYIERYKQNSKGLKNTTNNSSLS